MKMKMKFGLCLALAASFAAAPLGGAWAADAKGAKEAKEAAKDAKETKDAKEAKEPEEEKGGTSGNDYNFDGRFLVPFLQANFGWHDVGKIHFDFAVGLKAGVYLPDYNYYELDSNGDKISSTEQVYTTSQVLLEPQLRIRFGGEHLKFGLGFGFAWLGDLGDGQKGYNFHYDPFTVTAGITYAL